MLAFVRLSILHHSGVCTASARQLTLIVSLALSHIVRAVWLKGALATELRCPTRPAHLIIVWLAAVASVNTVSMLQASASDGHAHPASKRQVSMQFLLVLEKHGRSCQSLRVESIVVHVAVVCAALQMPISMMRCLSQPPASLRSTRTISCR